MDPFPNAVPVSKRRFVQLHWIIRAQKGLVGDMDVPEKPGMLADRIIGDYIKANYPGLDEKWKAIEQLEADAVKLCQKQG